MAQNALPATRNPRILDPLTSADGGTMGERFRSFAEQPAVKRSLPAVAAIGTLAAAGALYLAFASGPTRMLYTSLNDGERASVVAALDAGNIAYDIDPATGSLSVGEEDLYRARMLVASDGALAVPDNTAEMLNSIPLGSSRTLEGERLRNVRERELMLTIQEIDGVESVRVHLATAERSVFVRENLPPSASVMVRLARGRNLGEEQVRAIVNLVAASVPGLSPDAVRVVDQNGRLLSVGSSADSANLQLQREYEDKLRDQLSQLLLPMLGEGAFSSQVQVELDPAEVTSARESYDKDGAIRSESQSRATRTVPNAAGGIPGVLSNSPPPPAVLEEGPPAANAQGPGGNSTSGESSSRRSYELGREVAVSSTRPGSLRRISVAVAISSEALKKIRPATAAQVEKLVSAAVGADPARGDAVTVIASAFDKVETEEAPFYEESWFSPSLRYGAMLLALVLVLVFGIRPIAKALRAKQSSEKTQELPAGLKQKSGLPILAVQSPVDPHDALREQVELVRRMASEQPDRAVTALRRMLAVPAKEQEA